MPSEQFNNAGICFCISPLKSSAFALQSILRRGHPPYHPHHWPLVTLFKREGRQTLTAQTPIQKAEHFLPTVCANTPRIYLAGVYGCTQFLKIQLNYTSFCLSWTFIRISFVEISLLLTSHSNGNIAILNILITILKMVRSNQLLELFMMG